MIDACKEDWGAREPSRFTPLNPNKIKRIYIHWLGYKVDETAPFSILRNVQAHHMDRNGWSDIAYNLTVSEGGAIYEGRGLSHRNAANRGFSGRRNRTSISVCCLISTDKPHDDNDKMLSGLAELVVWLKQQFPTITAVKPHHAISRTSCPGPDLTRAIKEGRFPLEAPKKVDRVVNITKEDIEEWNRQLRERGVQKMSETERQSMEQLVMDVIGKLDDAADDLKVLTHGLRGTENERNQ